jgi:ketosteroid isomerase-like protein
MAVLCGILPSMPEESTTPDLVELMRASVEAGNSGDFDAMLSFFAPDGVWDMSPLGMGRFEGRAAIRAFLEDWQGAYEEFGVEAEEVLDLSNGVTLAVLVQRGRPVGSSGDVRLRYAAVTVWIDGLSVQLTNYTDIGEAPLPPNASPRNGRRRCRRT